MNYSANEIELIYRPGGKDPTAFAATGGALAKFERSGNLAGDVAEAACELMREAEHMRRVARAAASSGDSAKANVYANREKRLAAAARYWYAAAAKWRTGVTTSRRLEVR